MEKRKFEINMEYDTIYKKEFENYLFKMEFEGYISCDTFLDDKFRTTVFYPSKECMTFEQWLIYKGNPIRQWTCEERKEFMDLRKETPKKRLWQF